MIREDDRGGSTFRRALHERAPDRWSSRFGEHWLPVVISIPMLVVVPVLVAFTLYMTFVRGLPTEPGYTIQYWLDIARPYLLFTVIPNTLVVSLGAVVISLGFGIPLSWFVNRTRLPGRFRSLIVVGMGLIVIVPGFIQAMAWQMLVNPTSGIINKAIEGIVGQVIGVTINGLPGMAWVLGLVLTPSVFFMVSGAMRTLNSELTEAASIARLSGARTVFQIELPLVWPAILGAGLYAFMTAIAIFEVPAILNGGGGSRGVLSTELFYAVQPVTPVPEIHYGAAGVYGCLIMLPSFFAMHFYLRELGKLQGYGVIAGRGYAARLIDLGQAKYLGICFACFYLALALGLPLLVLIWTAMLPWMQPPSMQAISSLTFDNFMHFLPAIGGWNPIINTVVLMVAVSVIVMLISFMTSWLVVRTKLKFRAAIDVVAFSSHAIPAIAIAFDLYLVSLSVGRWVSLGGTLLVIALAHAIASFAPATRITNAALLQIHPQLAEAAQVCRAAEPISMLRVIAPLIKSSFLYGGVWTALLSAREVTMALFLVGRDNVVFSVAIWQLWQSGGRGLAAAAALCLIVIIGTCAAIGIAIASRIGGEAKTIWP
jgi:iron(III) transport system permease protein